MEHQLIDDESHLHRDELSIGKWVKTDFHALDDSISIKESAAFFVEHKVRDVPVVNEHFQYLGTLCVTSVMEALLKGVPDEEKIAAYINTEIKGLTIHETLSTTLLKNERLPVVDQHQVLIGVLHQTDVMEGLAEIYRKLDELENTIEWLYMSFDHIYEGIVFVDEHGFVRMINKAYCNYLGIDQATAIGQHIINVIEGTRLHIVIKTGIPEHNQVQLLQGEEVVAHRIPIWKNNKILGGVGILVFHGVSELYKVFERVQEFTESYQLHSHPVPQKKPKQEQLNFQDFVGNSGKFIEAKKIARKASRSSASILITGESGVGKEVFAKAIHNFSQYSDGPFISVNCAAIPESLLESELFGYEEGAFTGSRKKGKPGKFLLANKGTLFLDEIGDMPLQMQAKILRVLQEREVEPVGGTKPIPVEFRLIAATHRPLQEMVKEDRFREDLYYRLNVIPIYIPPLRERKDDIPLLLGQLMQKICKKYNIPVKEISKETVAVMREYKWPGNIRELENVLERLITLTEGDIYLDDFERNFLERKHISFQHSDQQLPEAKPSEITPAESYQQLKYTSEKELLLAVLKNERGNKTRAARKLGISRATLYNKLKQFGL